MPRDYINRPTTEAFRMGWDAAHTDVSDLTMARYLEEARPDESFAEWKTRKVTEATKDQGEQRG